MRNTHLLMAHWLLFHLQLAWYLLMLNYDYTLEWEGKKKVLPKMCALAQNNEEFFCFFIVICHYINFRLTVTSLKLHCCTLRPDRERSQLLFSEFRQYICWNNDRYMHTYMYLCLYIYNCNMHAKSWFIVPSVLEFVWNCKYSLKDHKIPSAESILFMYLKIYIFFFNWDIVS